MGEAEDVPELVRGDQRDREALAALADGDGIVIFASPGCGPLVRTVDAAWPLSPCEPAWITSSASPFEAGTNSTWAPLRFQARTACFTAQSCSATGGSR